MQKANLIHHHIHQLKKCTKKFQLSDHAIKFHAHIIKSAAHRRGPLLHNTLLDAYAKSGRLNDALQLFDEMPDKDLFSWTSLFTAYNQASMPKQTLLSFSRNLIPSPDHFLLSTLVKACAALAILRPGLQLHGYFIVSPQSDDDVVKSSLVDFYAKCGLPDESKKVFDTIMSKNVVSWTSLIYGYARAGRKEEAVGLLLHMPDKNVYTWSAAISGFVQGGHCEESFRIFTEVRRDGNHDVVEPFILSNLVVGSVALSSLELGKQLHGLVVRLGYMSGLYIPNTLVDMYAKCSDISSAEKIFNDTNERDVVMWTSIIVGMAQHGRASNALSLYNDMVLTGWRPNEVTFKGLIYACSHVGLVEKGRELFKSMTKDYGLKPDIQHYTCLMDLYSRSGHLEEAEGVLNSMPFKPDEAVWGSLLSACTQAGRTETGVRIADNLLELGGPESPSTCVLMSNVYARALMWGKVSMVRRLMTGMESRKKPGYSCVEIGKEREVFYAGETGFLKDEIFEVMKELDVEMRKVGYVPDTCMVLHDTEKVEKERQLFWHSERQAVAYGLIKSVPGKAIRIIKNLRVCGDCHVVLKLVSRIAEREIVVRDANRYHHFRDGVCSCAEFW